jgi:hypothetical protein
MNQLVRTLAKAHQALIEENPVEVTITYKIKEREGGGWRDRTEVVGPIRARLYQEATGRTGGVEATSTAGKQLIDARWGLITGPTADLRAGVDVKGTFETPLGRFEIIEVYPRQDLGEVWGWQAVVQRAS